MPKICFAAVSKGSGWNLNFNHFQMQKWMLQAVRAWKTDVSNCFKLVFCSLDILKIITQPARDVPGTFPEPSRQILVPRTSRGRPPPTSPGRPLKILFDRPGDVPVWRPGDVPIWHPGDVLKWRPGDVLIWRPRDVPGSLIRDDPRTFSGRRLEDLESTQTWMSKIFLDFSFRTYSIYQI